MVIHNGEQLPFPVLTNNTYDQSMTSKNKGTWSGDNSLERFVTTCNMIQQYKTNPGNRSLTDHAFEILNSPKLTDFNSGFNTRIIDKTLLESRSRITIPDPQKRALKAYNSTIHCE